MDADAIVVEDWLAGRAQEFATYWAKLVLEPARHSGWPRRLLLVSRGDRLEIGAFLTESERTELAGRLATLRAGLDDRQRSA